MRLLISLGFLVIAFGNMNVALGNLLVQRLPKEGEAVHYHLELTKDGQQPIDAELIVKSLNKTVEAEENCRWLEFVIRNLDESKAEIHSIHKVLISEKAVGTGKSPLQGIKRVWVAGPNLKPFRVELDFARSEDGYLFAVYLPNAFKELSEIQEAKTISYQSGELTIKTGSQARETFGDGKAKCDYRFWSHEKVPIGLAHAVVEFQDLEVPERAVKSSFVLTFKKTEANPKSLLPDAN